MQGGVSPDSKVPSSTGASNTKGPALPLQASFADPSKSMMENIGQLSSAVSARSQVNKLNIKTISSIVEQFMNPSAEKVENQAEPTIQKEAWSLAQGSDKTGEKYERENFKNSLSTSLFGPPKDVVSQLVEKVRTGEYKINGETKIFGDFKSRALAIIEQIKKHSNILKDKEYSEIVRDIVVQMSEQTFLGSALRSEIPEEVLGILESEEDALFSSAAQHFVNNITDFFPDVPQREFTTLRPTASFMNDFRKKIGKNKIDYSTKIKDSIETQKQAIIDKINTLSNLENSSTDVAKKIIGLKNNMASLNKIRKNIESLELRFSEGFISGVKQALVDCKQRLGEQIKQKEIEIVSINVEEFKQHLNVSKITSTPIQASLFLQSLDSLSTEEAKQLAISKLFDELEGCLERCSLSALSDLNDQISPLELRNDDSEAVKSNLGNKKDELKKAIKAKAKQFLETQLGGLDGGVKLGDSLTFYNKILGENIVIETCWESAGIDQSIENFETFNSFFGKQKVDFIGNIVNYHKHALLKEFEHNRQMVDKITEHADTLATVKLNNVFREIMLDSNLPIEKKIEKLDEAKRNIDEFKVFGNTHRNTELTSTNNLYKNCVLELMRTVSKNYSRPARSGKAFKRKEFINRVVKQTKIENRQASRQDAQSTSLDPKVLARKNETIALICKSNIFVDLDRDNKTFFKDNLSQFFKDLEPDKVKENLVFLKSPKTSLEDIKEVVANLVENLDVDQAVIILEELRDAHEKFSVTDVVVLKLLTTDDTQKIKKLCDILSQINRPGENKFAIPKAVKDGVITIAEYQGKYRSVIDMAVNYSRDKNLDPLQAALRDMPQYQA